MSQLNVNTVRAVGGTATPDTQAIGQGQTWQNFTVPAQRASGTTYTNNTGRPIMVSVYNGGGGQTSITILVNEITVAIGGIDASGSNNGNSVCAIVPNGQTYRVTGGISGWAELR